MTNRRRRSQPKACSTPCLDVDIEAQADIAHVRVPDVDQATETVENTPTRTPSSRNAIRHQDLSEGARDSQIPIGISPFDTVPEAAPNPVGREPVAPAGEVGTLSGSRSRIASNPVSPCHIASEEYDPFGPALGPQDTDHRITDASVAWEECAQRVWKHEQDAVEKWKDEISILLIFAGLFSAVLTAFNVQYYVSLQPQTPDATAEALVLLAVQMNALAARLGDTDVAQPTLRSAPSPVSISIVPTPVITVNALWFSALVFSLGAASIAISVNQWLHHHLTRADSMSRQSVRIWYFRRHGLDKWHIPLIISILPLLLQISLALFLIGLVQLLWTMNHIVAIVVTVLVTVLLTVSICTALIPAIAPDCPFKSPQAWWFFLLVRFWKQLLLPPAQLVSLICSLVAYCFHGIVGDLAGVAASSVEKWCNTASGWMELRNWISFDNFYVRSQDYSSKNELAMLAEADVIVMDESFLTSVTVPCIQASKLDAALPAFYNILKHRAHEVHGSRGFLRLVWNRSEQDGQLVIVLGQMCVDMFNRIVLDSRNNAGDRKEDQLRILDVLENLIAAMPNARSAVAVYSRLFSMIGHTDLSIEVRTQIGRLIYRFDYNFEIGVHDAQTLILAIPACRNFHPSSFSRISSSALKFATKLPETDLAYIRESIQKVLMDIADYFSRPNAEELGHELQDNIDWIYFDGILRACITLAGVDAALFNQETVHTLTHFTSFCTTEDGLSRSMREHVEQLVELTRQSPEIPGDIIDGGKGV